MREVLTNYAERLDEYLSSFHQQPEGLATVGAIGSNADERPNKIVLTVAGVERETSGGIAAQTHTVDGGFERQLPPLMMNLHIVVAAVYDSRRYAEGLSVLTSALRFIQSVPSFKVNNAPYTIEIETRSAQDMNNVWTLLGGQYYPSVMCKVRRLLITANETAMGGVVAREADVEAKSTSR